MSFLESVSQPHRMEQLYQCTAIFGFAFGGAIAGVRWAQRRAAAALIRVRDEHINLVETAVDRGEPTQVGRIILKVVEPMTKALHSETMRRIETLENRMDGRFSESNALMLRVVEGYQQLRMQMGLKRDKGLDEESS